jgi:subtilisin-like proprotein convertase family protein
MFRTTLLILMTLLVNTCIIAQNLSTITGPQFWTDIEEPQIASLQSQRHIIPMEYRAVQWQLPVLEAQIMPIVDQPNTHVVIQLPMPDGTVERFDIQEMSVMAPELQARYPQIRCFTGKGVDDPTAMIKCDLTPQGFHAMIQSNRHDMVFMDPYYHGVREFGVVYYKGKYASEEAHECLATAGDELHLEEFASGASPKLSRSPGSSPDFAGDCQRRRYRLALSSTGEYAAFHGGTKPLVLAAMNTSVNRVNQPFERDLAITLQLIPNNDTLIFLNASTDPFNNGSGGTMLGQNQTTVTARIGSANYDIGHVFSTGGGGIAGLGVVCNNGSKARGVTGSGSPIGDPFDIDYVIHEMGHQFGGNHCYNNSCGGNINNSTAMEPGSGSTIMAYAGICSPNVQNNSDDYFHAISIQEMSAYINTGTGNNCPVKTVTGNNAPTVANFPNFTIPRSTPFELTAQANDVDGDPLTYCWEQMDNQVATMPPVSTSTGGPLFRSYDPVSSPTRTFPRLPDLVTNTNGQWEELPGVARTMNFRVTVRDNFATAGCTAEDNTAITVNGTAGPFVVTVPNTNVTWTVGETQTVTWNVAGTNAAPINTSLVRIRLSTDGGFTYPILLADNEPNDGSATISVPDAVATTCRVRVEAVGNIYFDISNVNFRIQAPVVPTFVLALTGTPNVTACAGSPANYLVNVTGLAGFNTPVNFTVTGAPAGAEVQVTPTPVIPTGTTTVTITGLTSGMAGTYPITIQANGAAITQSIQAQLVVLPGAPTEVAVANSPANGATGLGVSPTLTWSSVQFAQNYEVEVWSATGGIVATLAGSNPTGVVPAQLATGTPYYWRVRASNDCGQGPWSSLAAFQIGGQSCGQTFNSTDVPLPIDINGVVVAESDLNVPVSQSIADVNVTMNIQHEWTGDLIGRLRGPDNTIIQLFDRPGIPAEATGCDGNDLSVTFDDAATLTEEDFESTCNNLPAASGTYQAIESLSVFNGKNTQGNWLLQITDGYPQFDSGSLLSWSLTFCWSVEIPAGSLLTNTALTVPSGGSRPVKTENLAVSATPTAADVIYFVLDTPDFGQLLLDGQPVAIGGTFTQADIDAQDLTYAHGTNTAANDAFRFDVWNSATLAWVHDSTFRIVILPNTLAGTASVTNQVQCANTSTGAITINATSGNEPFAYSLNGGTAQASNVFAGLATGTYTPVVTDALGFSLELAPVTLNNPAPISINTTVALDDLTVGASGGTGTLTFSIDGTNFQPDGQFDNLSDGIYTVVVRDANGCTATQAVAVSIDALLATAVQTATIQCFGAATGGLTVTTVGGVPPYSYSLDGTNFQPSATFTGLPAGTYTVSISDANGNLGSTTPVNISQPTAVQATATAILNQLTATATGGTAPYSYALTGGAAQSSGTFGGLTNATYTIIVTDANGCTVSATAIVDVPALVITNVEVSQNQCDNAVNALTINATGGVPPLEYRFNGGAWQASQVFLNPMMAVNNVAEVRDAAGTIITSNQIVLTNTPLLAAGTTVFGNTANVTATGGTSPYQYTLGGTTQNNGNYSGLPSGNYTVVVTDANGCTTSAPFVITYAPPIVNSVSVNATCGQNNGSITWSVSNGLAPFSYNPTQSWTNLGAGTYTITVTDAVGTTVVATATVVALSVPVLTATAPGNSTIVCSVTGGTPPYRYSLNGGAPQASSTFNNVLDGTYTVSVLDANNCNATFIVDVVGTLDLSSEWGLQVSPNPGNGLYQIAMTAAPNGPMLLQVRDLTGRLLLHETHTVAGDTWQTTIDLTKWPAGTYVLHLTQGAVTGAVRLSVVR